MAKEGLTDRKLLEYSAYVGGVSALARWGLSALGPEGWSGYKVQYNIFDNPNTGFYEAADYANILGGVAALVALWAFTNLLVGKLFGPDRR